jgi:hypothetical protein
MILAVSYCISLYKRCLTIELNGQPVPTDGRRARFTPERFKLNAMSRAYATKKSA